MSGVALLVSSTDSSGLAIAPRLRHCRQQRQHQEQFKGFLEVLVLNESEISEWIRAAWFSCSTQGSARSEITQVPYRAPARPRLRVCGARLLCSLQRGFIRKQTFYSCNRHQSLWLS